MSGFALQKVAERRLIIEQVAARRGILPVIVEKDFWVCWILGRIIECPAMAPAVVFKGGTSLSKVFGVIRIVRRAACSPIAPRQRRQGCGTIPRRLRGSMDRTAPS